MQNRGFVRNYILMSFIAIRRLKRINQIAMYYLVGISMPFRLKLFIFVCIIFTKAADCTKTIVWNMLY